MRHVDDGTIHAWLDAQVTDPASAAWIAEHLRECARCRARLDEERGIRDQADALLAAVAPVADSGRAAFDALAAKAAAPSAPGIATSPPDRNRPFRTWMIPVAWAASIALAVATGWVARDLAPPVRNGSAAPAGDRTPRDGQPSQSAQLSVARANDSTPPASPEVAPRPPAPPTRVPRRTEAPAKAVAAPEAAAGGAPAAAKPEEAVAFALQPTAGGPPSAPPRIAEPETVRTEFVGAVDTPSPVRPEVQRVAPAAMPVGAGGGRGTGARGGRGGGGGRGGQLPVGGGATLAQAPFFGTIDSVEGVVWRPLSRTEAAAQSGMALYGIEGLTPVVTTLSADAAMVRTVYRLDSGESVELVQQRIPGAASAGTRTGLAIASPAPVADAQSANAPAPWSTTRGNVQVTVRGASDPEALAARLRLD